MPTLINSFGVTDPAEQELAMDHACKWISGFIFKLWSQEKQKYRKHLTTVARWKLNGMCSLGDEFITQLVAHPFEFFSNYEMSVFDVAMSTNRKQNQ